MNRKELNKTFMMIPYWIEPKFGLHGLYRKLSSALKVKSKQLLLLVFTQSSKVKLRIFSSTVKWAVIDVRILS